VGGTAERSAMLLLGRSLCQVLVLIDLWKTFDRTKLCATKGVRMVLAGGPGSMKTAKVILLPTQFELDAGLWWAYGFAQR